MEKNGYPLLRRSRKTWCIITMTWFSFNDFSQSGMVVGKVIKIYFAFSKCLLSKQGKNDFKSIAFQCYQCFSLLSLLLLLANPKMLHQEEATYSSLLFSMRTKVKTLLWKQVMRDLRDKYTSTTTTDGHQIRNCFTEQTWWGPVVNVVCPTESDAFQGGIASDERRLLLNQGNAVHQKDCSFAFPVKQNWL